MSEAPWLTIVGVGEDGPDGLCSASRRALDAAEVVMGPPRHLALLPEGEAERLSWPVPFADGVEQLLGLRGRRVVALASGDPFWFGAGAVLARRLSPGDWRALPGRSCFALAAARLGWPLEDTVCLGLHAAPLARMRPALAPGRRLLALLRDGAAVAQLAGYLAQEGFGASDLHIMERLGGPSERLARQRADAAVGSHEAPVCVGVEVDGAGRVLPLASGRADDWFDSDGQITKRPVRALTLSALAPRPFEHLWDIGGGSGSIAIEWLLSDASLTATTIEPRPDRAARITANAARLGVERLRVVPGAAPAALEELEPPQAVFVGGGLDADLLKWLTTRLPRGTRIVANAVTLEAENLLISAQAAHGGDLLRVQLAETRPLGRKRGWQTAFPILQWSTVS
ncbi:precorrin-6y C5,15-methyltransferase (decarboxylating) subunit CbiE [Pseudooceanicola marinus]|nr:precorrin-6y C5,15-methyltransferase (decarboxylating) subunit CbiE [Pseudooceanicola marinus]PJE33065.1 bifunctional cobalt-precorrin-7 (C(5))-methyltransferase CbiE/decarboxylating cobalt-precorrin-6B (C(15))-methyltransferase CbiT [Pseudooceanicola marinus]